MPYNLLEGFAIRLMEGWVRRFFCDALDVRIYRDKSSLGGAAARFVAERISAVLEKKNRVRIIFATGASQLEFLETLIAEPIDWNRICAFHLDEYVNLPEDHPASFRRYLRERLFDRVHPAVVHYLDGNADDLEAECLRYSERLLEDEVDLACIGIGENGHIAFNDPPVADFQDSRWVKVVELDEACRRQQWGEGWFPTLDDVPRRALTLTIPAILRALAVSIVAPDGRKADAVQKALHGPLTTTCPASILRTHSQAILWLDEPAASRLSAEGGKKVAFLHTA